MPTDEEKQQKETEYKKALESYLSAEKQEDKDKFNKELDDRIKAFIKDGYKLEDIEKLSKDLFDSLPEEAREKFKKLFEDRLAAIKTLYEAETKQPPQEEAHVDSVAVIGEEKEDLSWEEAFKNVKQIQRVEKDADTGIISGKLKSGAEILAVPDKDAGYKLALKYKDKPKAEDCAALIAAAQEKGFNAIKLSDNVSAEFAKQMYLAAKKAGIKIIVPEQYKESLKDWEQEAANASKGKGERKPGDKGDKSDKKEPEEEKVDAYKKEVLRIASRISVTEKGDADHGINSVEIESLRKMIALSGLSADDILKDLAQDKDTYKKLKPFIEYVVRSTAPKKGYKPEENKKETKEKTDALAKKLIDAGKKGVFSKEDIEEIQKDIYAFAKLTGLKSFEEIQDYLKKNSKEYKEYTDKVELGVKNGDEVSKKVASGLKKVFSNGSGSAAKLQKALKDREDAALADALEKSKADMGKYLQKGISRE